VVALDGTINVKVQPVFLNHRVFIDPLAEHLDSGALGQEVLDELGVETFYRFITLHTPTQRIELVDGVGCQRFEERSEFTPGFKLRVSTAELGHLFDTPSDSHGG